MTKRTRMLERVGPFAAGVLIGSSMVTPAFAATVDAESLQPYLLLGSLLVLLVGLILKATAVQRSTAGSDDATERYDLRTPNAHSTLDIAMPAHAAQ